MLNFAINESSTIQDALVRINTNKKNFLIVVNDLNCVVGIVTDGDIRRLLLKGFNLSDKLFFNKEFKYLNKTDGFDRICNLFNNDKTNFLPVCDDTMALVNLITKKQFHILLLHNIEWNLEYDFLSLDENTVDYDVQSKPWGFYKSTILSEYFQSKVITVFPGEELSLQEHKEREEHWIIIGGKGKVILGGSSFDVFPGKYIFIPKEVKHKIMNIGLENLVFSEIQLGKYFGEDDIIRHSDKYNRNNS